MISWGFKEIRIDVKIKNGYLNFKKYFPNQRAYNITYLSLLELKFTA